MFTFFNKLRSRRSTQTFTGAGRPSIRKPAQPRRLELENLEERMVLSPISDKWWSLGGPSGFLGWNTGPETVAPDGIGRYEHFQGGMILWSPADGAHEVHGAILGDYANLGAEMSYLGYPQTDETTTGKGDGRYNRFDGGFIFWSPNTPASALDLHTIFKYASMGYEESVLGYPTSDATPIFGSFSRFHLPHIVGYYNTFQHGEIVWDASTNQAVEVQGAIWGEYLATANETDAYGTVVQSILGEPTSDEMDVPGVPGARMSTFQGGTIYWSPDVGAHVVYGGIGAYYVNTLGGPTGYGLPTSDEATYPGAPGARFTNFQNGGSIYWSATVGAHEVHGAINALYQGMGGPSSYLGMPTSDEQGIPFVSRYNYFENGKIVWTPAGAYAVQAATQMTFDSGNFGFDNGVPVDGWAELDLELEANEVLG